MRTGWLWILLCGCSAADRGSNPATDGAPSPTWTTQEVPDDPANPGGSDPGDLETQVGCNGVFNVDQVLDFHLEMDPYDWATLLADSTYSIVVSGTFRCGNEAPIDVGFRRKRSGGLNKVGLKVDFNEIIDGQRWHGLRKLTLENGVGEGNVVDDIGIQELVAEYLGWRIFNQGSGITGRAVFVDVAVNGSPMGAYIHLEQVDRSFLDDRFGENDGWLYKHSGGPNDGWKTHELDGLENPYDAYFCFWSTGNSCDPPPEAELIAELPVHLDLDQILWMGAMNAYIANADAPLFKKNNYYFYDSDLAPRRYIPWDLDSTMKNETDVRTGEGGGPQGGGGNKTEFDEILLAHWMPEYEAMLEEVLAVAPASVILDELDRVVQVAGPTLEADPFASGSAQGAADDLGAWWVAREADVAAQLGL